MTWMEEFYYLIGGCKGCLHEYYVPASYNERYGGDPPEHECTNEKVLEWVFNQSAYPYRMFCGGFEEDDDS